MGLQRSALKAKLAEREDNCRVSYYISESAALDAEILSLVRDHLRLVRYFVDHLEVSSRILKNLQEVGRRAMSEPVGGVREFRARVEA